MGRAHLRGAIGCPQSSRRPAAPPRPWSGFMPLMAKVSAVASAPGVRPGDGDRGSWPGAPHLLAAGRDGSVQGAAALQAALVAYSSKTQSRAPSAAPPSRPPCQTARPSRQARPAALQAARGVGKKWPRTPVQEEIIDIDPELLRAVGACSPSMSAFAHSKLFTRKNSGCQARFRASCATYRPIGSDPPPFCTPGWRVLLHEAGGLA